MARVSVINEDFGLQADAKNDSGKALSAAATSTSSPPTLGDEGGAPPSAQYGPSS